MPRIPTKSATGHALKGPSSGAGVLREITVDDVIGALLDLFAKLEIDAPHLVSRVKAINGKATVSHRLSPHFAAIGELLARWHQDPSYLDELGDPLPLKIRGTRRSFGSLARATVPNIGVSRLISELERIGAIAIDTDQSIHVRMRSLPVYEDRRLAIEHTLTSLDSFIRTLRHNLDSDPSNADQLFHRIAWNANFDSKLIPALKIKVRRQGQNFLESFDNWMMRKSKTNSRRLKRRREPSQVSIGVYMAVGK
jgi:hypothetical protein